MTPDKSTAWVNRTLMSLVVVAGAVGLASPLSAQTKPTTMPATRPGVVGGTPGAGAFVVPPLPTFATVAADPIERPEFRAKAHPITKNVTSATAMMVILTGDGGEVGMTSDVIATVGSDSRGSGAGKATFVMKQGNVGPQMSTSFDEAIRAVKLRYPRWESGNIEFSFGEKYTAHDGGSAGTCFAVMMLSELEGFDIDPKCAVTGDITVDWKVRKIGGTAAKLRGATADKCLYAGVPVTNSAEVADMFLLYGYESIRDIQVFSLETLQDAVALLRKDRTPQLMEAMKEFAALQPQIRAKSSLNLPVVQKALEQILVLAPNHESAKWLLAIGKGTAPKQLTMGAAMEHLRMAMNPFFEVIMTNKEITRKTVPQAMTVSARKELNMLRPIAPKEFMQVVVDCTQIVDASEMIATRQSSPTVMNQRMQTFITHWQALGMDKDFREKLIRE